MPNLLDMTDLPMTVIIMKLDYKSILTLRKVCHSLRNSIDAAAGFKTDLDNIDIYIGPTGFSVTCNWLNGISANDWTSNDLKVILKMAKNKLSRFSVITNPDNVGGLDDFEEILKNQTRPIKTERFKIGGSGILQILPYLHPKYLKEISIKNYDADDQNLGIEQLLELEQFQNTLDLHIDHCYSVHAPLRKFFHFQTLSVNLHGISLEDLVALKEAFVTSTHMESFGLNGDGLNEVQLEQVFGTPFDDPFYELGGPLWFFKIQSCKEHVLKIEWMLDSVRFCKLKAEEVPRNAVVQD
ncbi:unnamed protein product [Caenorhabditis brenneri]